jgi:hypothetical protein
MVSAQRKRNPPAPSVAGAAQGDGWRGGLNGPVKDANGQALSYMYFEKERLRRFRHELLTRDEAERIAAVFAKLPEMLSKPATDPDT